MKKHYLALLAFALPIAASAQISGAETYVPGDQIHAQPCSVPASPGSAGTGQTWNFASVVDSGDEVTTWVLDDTASADPNDIILSADPNNPIGTPIHKTGTQNLLVSINFGLYTLTYTPGQIQAENSFNYNAANNLSYAVSGSLMGGGNVDFMCDGTGTLTTPQGNYPNAYRVMMMTDESDSINVITMNYLVTHNVSYVWYDNNHKAPLFRIDSVYRQGTGALLAALSDTSATAQYLQAFFPAAVNNVAAAEQTESANITGSNLVVNANLKNGQQYELNVFNVSGQKVFNSAFSANNSVEHFNLNAELAAGTYFVNIYQKGSGKAPIIIKTVKE